MKMKNLLVFVFLFIAISCSSVDEKFIEKHLHPGADDKIETTLTAEEVVACPTGYIVCGAHGDCIPTRTSYVCGKDVSSEWTRRTVSSLVCSWSTSSTSYQSHNYQLTWYSYVATADRTGHTYSAAYKCSNNLSNCGIACGQTKNTTSGWLAHSPGSNPSYCAYCGIKYR
jgi:hypothetical protein